MRRFWITGFCACFLAPWMAAAQAAPSQEAKPALAEFDLVYPNYRGLIFPGAADIQVNLKLQPRPHGLELKDLAVEFSARGSYEKIMRPRITAEKMQLAAESERFNAGPVKVRVSVRKGEQELVAREWDLKKLAPAEVAKLKVYIDQHNNTIVNGKPFFPLGWYDSPDEKHLAEIAQGPFNCILDYGTNLKPKAWMLKYLDEVHRRGMKIVYCLNDVYPTAKYLEGKGWEGITGNEAILDAVVKAYRDHPAVLAWYLNDELPRELAPRLEKYYQRVRELDPDHPCYIVLCNMGELSYFRDTTDIYGVDPYPIPANPVTLVSSWMDLSNAAVKGRKPTWLVPQAFAWYQYNPAGSNRARQPSAAELKTGRAPTYDEARCMTYLALTHGAKGLIYYCYYDLRVLPQYAERWAGLKRTAGEVKALSPMLLSPDDLGAAKCSPPDAPIHSKLKEHNGKLYLLAVNAGSQPCKATFELPRPVASEAKVLFGRRTAAVEGGRIVAEFKPLEARVYEMETR